jgi:ATP-dependent DNA helicase RecG
MMDYEQLLCAIAAGETLTTEFKSEERRMIDDIEIYENVVCLANTDGGSILIGVENNGRISGARPRHGGSTDPFKLQAAIFANTEPRINTRVYLVQAPVLTATTTSPLTVPRTRIEVLVIEVDPYPEICATKTGKCLRRIMSAQGPQCAPFYPHEHISRRVVLGLLDFTALPCQGADFNDLNPLEFERLRQTVQRLHGDSALLNLTDIELAKALQLVETVNDQLIPNYAGLLLLGRDEPLRRLVPTHEAAFQVMDAQSNVLVNDFFRGSLLATIEAVQNRFDARLNEQEVMIGMFRLPVPEYGRIAFREALLNALLHRDYSLLGTVFVQWQHDHMLITNPGGLPEGITLQNLLTHEPKPRNPLLYDAAKRIGLVEKTGRGIDKIFFDQLRSGRPAPDYDRSDSSGVRVVLRGGKANLEFARFVYEQDKAGHPLTLDDLLILNQMELERRIDAVIAAALIQKPLNDARAVLERLLERGMIDAKGEKKGRVYHLNASYYRQLGQPEGYVRAHGISSIRHEAMILEYVQAHHRIERKDVMRLCGISSNQAGILLSRMVADDKLERKGTPPRWTHYVLPDTQ